MPWVVLQLDGSKGCHAATLAGVFEPKGALQEASDARHYHCIGQRRRKLTSDWTASARSWQSTACLLSERGSKLLSGFFDDKEFAYGSL